MWVFHEDMLTVRRRFLTFDEADRLVEAGEPKWFPMIALALKTGLRMGELIALELGDVDLFTGRLVVRRSNWRGQIGSPKNGRAREFPLSDETVRILKTHRHLRGELVFCDERGESLAYETGRDPLRRACRRAGLRNVGWHTLRHTFASHLAMRGGPLKAIRETSPKKQCPGRDSKPRKRVSGGDVW